MIQKLVWENVKHRPLRTLLSALLIAIPVTLVLTLMGLSQGLLEDNIRRTRGVGADILIRPKGSSFLSGATSAPIDEKLLVFLRQQPHVKVATGIVIQQVNGPLASIAGIDLAEFDRMSGGFRYISGGPLQEKDDILVDEVYARERKLKVGDVVRGLILNRDWTVRGIVETGKLNRIFADLRQVQELTGNTGHLGPIYIKVDRPENIPALIELLKQKLEDYPILSMDQFLSMFSVDNIPLLAQFLSVMNGITVTICFAVVCLSMYMAVLQRTREIGILKSLGAAKTFVLGLILWEAGLMSVAGTIIGIGLSFGTTWGLRTFVPASLPPTIVPEWWPRAFLIAGSGALLGSLYPGWRAASQDPIEALAYE